MPKTKEERAAYKKEWYERNKERLAARQKEYNAENKEKIAARSKEYYAENKEKIAAKRKEYEAENKEKIAAKQKEYRAKNKEKFAAKRKTPAGIKSRVIREWKRLGLIYDDTDSLYCHYLNATHCDECGIEFGKKGDGSGTFKCMDHCHHTGAFRNFLCNPCNLKRGP